MHALFKLFSMKCKELCKRLIARLPDKILKYSTSIKKKKTHVYTLIVITCCSRFFSQIKMANMYVTCDTRDDNYLPKYL